MESGTGWLEVDKNHLNLTSPSHDERHQRGVAPWAATASFIYILCFVGPQLQRFS